MNLPNMLTSLRFLLIPVFIYNFYYNNENHYFEPLLIFVLAGLTDILDGYIARKYNKITKWGKLSDPLVDKLFQLSVLFALGDKGLLPFWVFYIFLLKEVFIIIGSGLLYKNKVTTQANWYGKLATVLFYCAIVVVIFADGFYGMSAIIIAIITSLYAGIRYSIEYFKIRKGANAINM